MIKNLFWCKSDHGLDPCRPAWVIIILHRWIIWRRHVAWPSKTSLTFCDFQYSVNSQKLHLDISFISRSEIILCSHHSFMIRFNFLKVSCGIQVKTSRELLSRFRWTMILTDFYAEWKWINRGFCWYVIYKSVGNTYLVRRKIKQTES